MSIADCNDKENTQFRCEICFLDYSKSLIKKFEEMQALK